MMRLLQGFNANWRARYSQDANSPAAESVRATLMVSALSYAFQQDLRAEFKALNFPVDDAVHAELIATAPQPGICYEFISTEPAQFL
jgi:hypothetical protein